MSPGPAPSWLLRFDHAAIEFTRRHGLRILRVALGLVFLWFGALKLLDVSPVADLVAQTVYWLPAELVVRGLGGLEIVIGLGLLTGWAIRATLALFFGQMLGTFLVFVVHPDRTFQGGNPLKLTVLGEFVVKNLVLIAAGIAIGSTIPKARRAPLPAMLKEKATP